MEISESFDFTLRPGVGSAGELDAVWRELAATVGHPEPLPSAESLAALVVRHAQAEEVAGGVMDLLRMTFDADPGDEASIALRERTGMLIAGLSADLLARALRSDPNPAARRLMLEWAIEQLPIPSLPKLTMAALEVHEHAASPALFGVLDRLRALAVGLPAPHAVRAEAALRAIMRRALLLASSGEVRNVAQQFASAERRSESVAAPILVEPERALAIALAADAAGDVAWTALAALLDGEGDQTVMELLRRAPPSETVDQVAWRLATPRRLTWLVRREPLDVEGLDTLLRVMGGTAAVPLVEELCESGSRQVRRVLIERLSRLPERVPGLAYPRLRDRRWYVVRNMLALLRQCGGKVDSAQVKPLLKHDDARVRREAVLLLVGAPDARAAALVEGLRDTDRNVVRAALQGARSGLPDAAVPVLAQRLEDPVFAPEHRVLALHLLGRSSSTLALEALLRFAGGGRGLLGRPRLAPRSAEMLAALAGLVRRWRGERRAAALLAVAARSRDEQIVQVLAGRLQAAGPLGEEDG